MKRKIIRSGLIVILSLLSVCVFTSAAQALSVGDRGILPANPNKEIRYSDIWFIYSLNPGESKEDAAKLMNNSEEDVTFEVYAVDATTTNDGSFAPLLKNAERKDVGSWVKMSQDRVTVPAKSVVEVPFTITLPENDIDVGEHIGALVIEEVQDGDIEDAQGARLSIVTRVGVRMYVTVPGEIRRDLEITDFRHTILSRLNFMKEIVPIDRVLDFLGLKPAVRFNIAFENKGNVHLELIGKLKIKNIFGRTIKTIDDIGFGIITPSKPTNHDVDWIDPPVIGKFNVTAEVDYGYGDPKMISDTVWIIPYPLLIIIAIIIVLIIIFRLLFQLVVAKEKSKMHVHKVVEGDTIESVAEQYHVRWKYLARVNKLKPPYQLKVGQELLIPKENLWLSFIKSFFTNKKNLIILAIVIIIIAGVIIYWNWHNDRERQRLIDEAAEKDRQRQEQLQIVLGERRDADQRRKDDLHKIQEALERYHEAEGRYPIAVERSKTTDVQNIFETELLNKGHLLKACLDPKHPDYYYGYKSDAEGTTYELTCVLEYHKDEEGIKIEDYLIYKLVPETESDSGNSAEEE